jgi:sterol O-acyltransferase
MADPTTYHPEYQGNTSCLLERPLTKIEHSGRSTPLPADAPPSVQSISSARKQVRAQNQKHRLFPTVDYSARVSHFDPKSEYRDFRGFFILFWIGLGTMVLTTVLRNIKDTGYPLRVHVWALLTANTLQIGISDLVMIGSTTLSLPLQKIFRNSKGWLRWENCGMPIQALYQAGWIILWVKYAKSTHIYTPPF